MNSKNHTLFVSSDLSLITFKQQIDRTFSFNIRECPRFKKNLNHESPSDQAKRKRDVSPAIDQSKKKKILTLLSLSSAFAFSLKTKKKEKHGRRTERKNKEKVRESWNYRLTEPPPLSQ